MTEFKVNRAPWAIAFLPQQGGESWSGLQSLAQNRSLRRNRWTREASRFADRDADDSGAREISANELGGEAECVHCTGNPQSPSMQGLLEVAIRAWKVIRI